MLTHVIPEPEPLPIVSNEDRRIDIVSKYSNKVWRLTSLTMIKAVLENLYEEAYSSGLRDMDKMHDAVDSGREAI